MRDVTYIKKRKNPEILSLKAERVSAEVEKKTKKRSRKRRARSKKKKEGIEIAYWQRSGDRSYQQEKDATRDSGGYRVFPRAGGEDG